MSRLKRRRTKSTIFLMPEQRRIIKKSGKAVQHFFMELLNLYVMHDLASWREGHIYLRQVRRVFLAADLMNNIVDHLANPYSVGRKVGESARRTNLVIWNLTAKKTLERRKLFRLMNQQSGWGIFTGSSPGRIVIESPAITNEPFLRGYLEGALSSRLRTMQATLDRMVFQIVK